ncbi:MAG: hypothetical protein U0172_03435 [Nitrospiraceae bacterium]
MAQLSASVPLVLNAIAHRIETPLVAVPALTSEIVVRIQRPTTLVPLAWDAASTLRVTLRFVVDGVEHLTIGTASGGVRTGPQGELSEYVIRYKPTVLFGQRARDYMVNNPKDPNGFYYNVPLTRLGELGSTVRAGLILERLSGTISTTITVAATNEAPAPVLARHHNSVAFDAATTVSESGGDGVLTTTHTAGGADRAVFVGAGVFAASPLGMSSVTYGGVGLTQLWSIDFAAAAYLNAGYQMVAPTTGAQTVTATAASSAPLEQGMGIMSLTGVNQANPVGTAVTTTGNGTSPSLTVATPAADSLVVDAVVIGGLLASAGADQTERYAINGSPFMFQQGSTQSGASGGVMSWSAAVAVDYGLAGIEFLPKSSLPPFTVGKSALRDTDALRGVTPTGPIETTATSAGVGATSSQTSAPTSSTGAIPAAATVSGASATVRPVVESSAGVGAAAGQSAVLTGVSATASGVASPNVVVAAIVTSSSASAGAATVTGVGEDAAAGGTTATAAGSSTVAATAAAFAKTATTIAASAAASGISAARTLTTGASAGVASPTGVAASIALTSSVIAGSATVGALSNEIHKTAVAIAGLASVSGDALAAGGGGATGDVACGSVVSGVGAARVLSAAASSASGSTVFVASSTVLASGAISAGAIVSGQDSAVSAATTSVAASATVTAFATSLTAVSSLVTGSAAVQATSSATSTTSSTVAGTASTTAPSVAVLARTSNSAAGASTAASVSASAVTEGVVAASGSVSAVGGAIATTYGTASGTCIAAWSSIVPDPRVVRRTVRIAGSVHAQAVVRRAVVGRSTVRHHVFRHIVVSTESPTI